MTSYHIGLRENIETLFAVHREFVAEPYGDEFQTSEPSEEVPNPIDEHPEEEQ